MGVVVITGCSSGIGLESALAFARRGDTVYATMRNLERAGTLRERAAAEDLTIEVLQLDVTDDESVASAIAEVESRSGAIDVLVNNAGVGYSGPVETIDIDRARSVLETNFWGAVRTVRAALPKMRERGSGVIVNVTSTAGRVPGNCYNAFYGASKHALGALSEALTMEVGAYGLRVVCIEPGFFATAIFEKSDWDRVDEASPYGADHAWMAEFYVKSGEAMGGPPSAVADAILAAVDDPATPTHVLVGDDAFLFVDLVQQAGTFEAWLPVGTTIVEGVSGPRPVTPKFPVTP
jgi:NAD(P)-dependent dehydrogenase (short-subunit alcohol dehydrogenase family)